MGSTTQEGPALDWSGEALPAGYRSGFAVLWGRPNVGKSTLLNQLLGLKISIVSPKPQTTRNCIAGVSTLESAQIVYWDTPGIHQPQHRLGQYLVNAARSSLPEAEVVVFVVDGSKSPGEEDRLSAKLLKEATRPVLLAVNKADLLDAATVHRRMESYRRLRQFEEVVPVSALAGTHVEELKARLVSLLPEGPPYYPPGMITDHPESFMLAEMIREAALHLTHQEVPHSLAVIVEEMLPRNDNLTYVAATIHVERDSQKGIVIGEGGRMLRQIGLQAREAIERWLNCRIFLELRVRVRAKWRNDESSLRRFGYAVTRRAEDWF